MKVAVTGASGFIGKYIIPALLDRGVDVYAVSRNLNKLSKYSSTCKLVEIDIKNFTETDIEKISHVDALLHLAWDGLPNYHSLHHIEDELPAQYKFIKALVSSGVENISIVGTCFEYGMVNGELSEAFYPHPENAYGYAKNALREQLEYFRKSHFFNLTWMRLFYMYGDGQSDNSLYSQLYKAISNSEEVFNMSGGEQLRDYLKVDTVAVRIAALALKLSNIGVVNICSGEPTSIRGLVEKWLAENNWKIKLNFGYYPYPDYEPFAFWGDDSYMNELLTEK